jgi:hypothetical protein
MPEVLAGLSVDNDLMLHLVIQVDCCRIGFARRIHGRIGAEQREQDDQA